MSGASDEAGWAYRPQLDGMRALAVYLVVGFHAGLGHLRYGFVGVDVFFVLSGYLVTHLLVRDLDGRGGRVRFGRFYSRRARRLLPAAAVNLIVTAIVFGAIAAPIELPDAQSGIQAASLYYANWHFIHQASDYFAADIATNPVIQYWSLSVEEQFYLAWPLLLTGIFVVARRAGTRRVRVIQALVAAGAVASAALALSLADTQLDRAYMGTFSRAYQLLAGALLALTPGIVARAGRTRFRSAAPVLAVGFLLAILATAANVFSVNPIQRGLVITALTIGLLVSLEASARGPARAVLSWSPVTYLGQVSYGTYIWHWLVVVVLAREAEIGTLATAVITAVVATGLASLSYQLLEQPIRTSPTLDRLRPVVLGCAVALSLLVGLVVAPRIFDRAEGRAPEVAAATGTVEASALPTRAQIASALRDTYAYGSCQPGGPKACPLRTGGGQTAMVIGDSHAGVLTPMLTDIARRHDLTLEAAYLPYCPWTRGVEYVGASQTCEQDQDRVFDQIVPAVDPDIVFLAHRAIDDPQDPVAIRDREAGTPPPGSERADGAVDRRVAEVVRRLRADGRTVVLLEPTPVVAEDANALTCLSRASSLAECRRVASPGPRGEERTMRRLAADDDGVVAVDLDPYVCPYLPICDPVVGGRIVMRDHNHLTVGFASTLADPVDQTLTARGVFG